MLDIAHFFLSAAFAQGATEPTAATAASTGPLSGMSANPTAGLMGYLPVVLIFGVFYFLVIRPQQAKLNDQTKMVKALQRGDRVITNGGLHGKISRLDGDDILILEIADGVEVKQERSQVQALEAKTQPLNASDATTK